MTAQPTAGQIRSLERYRLNAHLVRKAFHHHWDTHVDPERQGRGDPEDPEFFAWMSLWYSTVQVVLEGCRDLDIEINLRPELLDEWRRPLELFRNKTFHPQTEFPHPFLTDYIAREDSVAWVYALSAELGAAIEREARRLGLARGPSGFYL
ncbi:hypothetical protein Q9S36_03065 [Microbacterium sp. ARD31]|uniref:hypothetical protein n=1 Tax=Microbacterium sp. ARD31 TaxID=2962576 RepID=UPI002881A613|nr:hypothetical protein [Microbacterium sp. ARD31]MDT0179188.1 hypothetical protein [Microbacterium sp. ARD31]